MGLVSAEEDEIGSEYLRKRRALGKLCVGEDRVVQYCLWVYGGWSDFLADSSRRDWEWE